MLKFLRGGGGMGRSCRNYRSYQSYPSYRRGDESYKTYKIYKGGGVTAKGSWPLLITAIRNRHPLRGLDFEFEAAPEGVGDKSPSDDNGVPARVDVCDFASAVDGADDASGGIGDAHEHGVSVCRGVEQCRIDESGSDVDD